MNIGRAHKALETLAAREGISIEELGCIIRQVIDETAAQLQVEDKAEKQREWEKIPCLGETPTPAELIAYLADRLMCGL